MDIRSSRSTAARIRLVQTLEVERRVSPEFWRLFFNLMDDVTRGDLDDVVRAIGETEAAQRRAAGQAAHLALA